MVWKRSLMCFFVPGWPVGVGGVAGFWAVGWCRGVGGGGGLVVAVGCFRPYKVVGIEEGDPLDQQIQGCGVF